MTFSPRFPASSCAISGNTSQTYCGIESNHGVAADDASTMRTRNRHANRSSRQHQRQARC
eukprot:713106-Prorocentrum_minimum.AAC.1